MIRKIIFALLAFTVFSTLSCLGPDLGEYVFDPANAQKYQCSGQFLDKIEAVSQSSFKDPKTDEATFKYIKEFSEQIINQCFKVNPESITSCLPQSTELLKTQGSVQTVIPAEEMGIKATQSNQKNGTLYFVHLTSPTLLSQKIKCIKEHIPAVIRSLDIDVDQYRFTDIYFNETDLKVDYVSNSKFSSIFLEFSSDQISKSISNVQVTKSGKACDKFIETCASDSLSGAQTCEVSFDHSGTHPFVNKEALCTLVIEHDYLNGKHQTILNFASNYKECIDDADCESNEQCSAALCKTKPTDSSGCTNSFECGAYGSCINGRCSMVDQCFSDFDCPLLEDCVSGRCE